MSNQSGHATDSCLCNTKMKFNMMGLVPGLRANEFVFDPMLLSERDLGDGDNNFFPSHFAPTKTPNKRESVKKIKGCKRRNNKENQHEIDKATNSAVEVDEVLAAGRPWLDADKTKLFTWLFGAEGDANFETHKKDPARIYKKMILILYTGCKSALNNNATAATVKGQITRAIKAYDMIIAFEKFTGGGGGGDGDLNSDGDDSDNNVIAGFESHLKGACSAGHAVGGLTAKVINQWYKLGWYDLFNDRLGKSLKITHEVACHSASAVSLDEIKGLSSDIEAPSAPPSSKKVKLPASHTVTEPKHKAATKFHTDTAASLSSLGEFLKQKAVMDDKRFMLVQEKATRNHKRDEQKRVQDERQDCPEMAKVVLSMDGASDETKAAANNYLLNLFTI
ncbi:hypothetical protein PILCRDRAFT_90815 [Piloderma croceum F 1598]|uniref:Uncharacterized protein n=1 Tax=Piloderma croceum (strain F 1598) TaxID=765440 RepID=A0A0C3FDV6_PILCF|nr:hypothetical protein PILCRDRAFT_90815 [Piloderma croceum F 1598]